MIELWSIRKEEYANFTIRVSGYAVKFIDRQESSSWMLLPEPATTECKSDILK
ncbi:MAG: hypothetical protein ACLT4D_07985 [Blautia faecis]